MHGPVLAKGINFRSFFGTLARLRGQAAVDATIAALPEEIASAVRLGAVVASGWYPATWYRELHRATRKACAGAGFDLARQIGREAAYEEFRGIYRFLLKVISAQTIVAHTPRIFGMYFQGGDLRCIEAAHGSGALCFERWQGFDKAVWCDVAGGIEGVLVARGAIGVTHRIRSGGGDDGNLTIEFRWA